MCRSTAKTWTPTRDNPVLCRLFLSAFVRHSRARSTTTDGLGYPVGQFREFLSRLDLSSPSFSQQPDNCLLTAVNRPLERCHTLGISRVG